MVSQCVQSRTGASAVSIFGGNVLWPLAICTRMSPWRNMAYLEIRRNQIEPEQPVIPSEDSKALEKPGNRRNKEHGSWGSSYVQGSRRAVSHFIVKMEESCCQANQSWDTYFVNQHLSDFDTVLQ